MAKGYYNLANVNTLEGGDLVKAEMLARESYRISLQLYGNDHILVGLTSGLLGKF